jgi:hypothetical protein
VITNSGTHRRARLVGRHVESLVDLPGIGYDDLSIESLRKLETKLRLADPGRPDDDGDFDQ